jgi:hypothetical protein
MKSFSLRLLKLPLCDFQSFLNGFFIIGSSPLETTLKLIYLRRG